MKKNRLFPFVLSLAVAASLSAQYRKPLDIPLLLSGNFGELRNNHFHSGIDMKTQIINRPVYCAADGYVSRIYVSPSGYGRALYVTHPQTGQVSVYGHLNAFMPEIAAYVKEKQYEKESFKVDLFPDKTLFAVKKGEVIAYSGNAGSSGGPHLHFEIRDGKTENILDPLPYMKSFISDNVAPEIRGIAVYPLGGTVNNSLNPFRQAVTKTKKGEYAALKKPIAAWGAIGVAVKAYDRMNGTSNSYGVKRIRLYVDNKMVFESNINSYSFDESPMLNSLIDFDDWRRNKSFYMKSFVEPGNMLPFYETANNGCIVINQERIYNLRYELSDAYGNTTAYDFQITGQRQHIPPEKKGPGYMAWNRDNRCEAAGFTLFIPAGSLYADAELSVQEISAKNNGYYSGVFKASNKYIPFRKNGELRIQVTHDTLKNKKQYGIVSIVSGKESWLGGVYNKGYVQTDIREIGQQFAVSADTIAPEITPVPATKQNTGKTLKLRVSDNKSGIASFRGTIDGKFALFEHDIKSPVYTCRFDPQYLIRGKMHQLIFTATDACGNTAKYETEFYY